MADLASTDLELLEPPKSGRKRYLKIAVVVFLAWSAIGITNAFQRFANTADMRAEYPLWALTKIAMVSQWIKAALSLPVIWMVARYPFERGTWKRRVPLYLFALVVYVIVFILVRPYLVPTFFYNPATGRTMQVV